MRQFFGKKSRNALTLVLFVSLAVHVVGILIFGTIKFVSEALREETVFEAVPIAPPPQKEPEYTVNLQQRNQSTPPPRPPAIVVNNPSELDIPALDIDVNVDSSAVYGRGGGGFGGGLAGLREMSLDISFFGTNFSGDAGRMLFVIDMSGSMIMSGRGLDGYRNVVEELVKALENMNNQGAFNIIAFSGGVETFKASFASVSNASIQEAREWLMERDPAASVGGIVSTSSRAFPERHKGTSSGKALETAFKKRPGAIFFLSDGEPTDMTPDQIYKLVGNNQGANKVPINTISYKSTSAFLKQLADTNDGKYTQVR